MIITSAKTRFNRILAEMVKNTSNKNASVFYGITMLVSTGISWIAFEGHAGMINIFLPDISGTLPFSFNPTQF